MSLRSMTGYSVAKAADGQQRVQVEIRSYNHRFLDIGVRLPSGWQAFEERIRRAVAESVTRGRLEIAVTLEEFATPKRTVILDQPLLAGYVAAFRQAKEWVGDSTPIRVESLLNVPDLFVPVEEPVETEAAWPLVEASLVQALANLTADQIEEGKRLESDLLMRLEAISQYVEQVEHKTQMTKPLQHVRLRARLNELLGTLGIDEQRLAQEIAVLVDRYDITEEIVRLRSHMALFRETCASGGAVGRKLDFILQELHREANTIAAKAGDASITAIVVEVKAEIERMREQVQNIG